MSNSTDSLRKKVCVTVFLDELFEEVPEDERKDLKQVEELPESRVKVSDDPYVEPSPVNLRHDEKGNVSPANVDPEPPQILLRPRKHRKESKFSENRYDSFKKELSKYGYGSGNKKGGREPSESAVSDSDFDLDDILEVDKWGVSRSSFSELSEIDMMEGTFLSMNPIPSLNCRLKKGSRLGERPNSGKDKSGPSYNKSTQFDGADPAGNVVFVNEGQNAGDDSSAWKGIQKQIQLLLYKIRSPEDDTCKGDRVRAADQTSILEECVKKNENGPASTPVDQAPRNQWEATYFSNSELSDSYTCVFPHNRRRRRARAPEVERVWENSKRSAWNDGFESDLSEPDCHAKGVDLQNDSVLRYTSCLKKSNENFPEWKSKGHTSPVTEQSTSRQFLDDKTPKADLKTDADIKTVTNKSFLETMLNVEEEEKTGREGDHTTAMGKRLPSVEGRNKNFAEGDAFENLEVKVLVCDKIMKSQEMKAVDNEIIVNRAEIELDPQDGNAETVDVSPELCPPSKRLPDVLFEKTQVGDAGKVMTDADSEMIFAENEHFSMSEVVVGGTYFGEHDKDEVCIVEFEGKLSRSKILRRIKTVEIVGNGSLKDMKNISTEVILICENINDRQVCLETWQSNASNSNSISNMGQCYLKDSKDSAMYLIEIPLQFTRHNKEKSSDSDRHSKTSDSD